MISVREEYYIHFLLILVMVGSGVMYWLLATMQTSYNIVIAESIERENRSTEHSNLSV